MGIAAANARALALHHDAAAGAFSWRPVAAPSAAAGGEAVPFSVDGVRALRASGYAQAPATRNITITDPRNKIKTCVVRACLHAACRVPALDSRPSLHT